MQRLGRGRKQPHGLSSGVEGLFGAAAVGGTRYRVTGTAVRGRTARACREPSCPRWAEGRLGGDNEPRQSKAGAGWQPGRSRVVKAGSPPLGMAHTTAGLCGRRSREPRAGGVSRTHMRCSPRQGTAGTRGRSQASRGPRGSHSPEAWAGDRVVTEVGAASRPSAKPSSSRSARPRAAVRDALLRAIQALHAPPTPGSSGQRSPPRSYPRARAHTPGAGLTPLSEVARSRG